jgi:hypothetical protein
MKISGPQLADISAPASDEIVPTWPTNENVSPAPTHEGVPMALTSKPVSSGPPHDEIKAAAPLGPIVPKAGEDEVFPIEGLDTIVAPESANGVGARGAAEDLTRVGSPDNRTGRAGATWTPTDLR